MDNLTKFSGNGLHVAPAVFAPGRPWDARLARCLVAPLAGTWVTPNHLTTVRLGVGLAAAAAFVPGTYGWSIIAALLLVLSNFLDHADGELARLTGSSSRLGHLYDVASDAVVTVLLFVGMGAGLESWPGMPLDFPVIGTIAGTTIALIFYVRMRIEELAGKSATRQTSWMGFETEDVLYLVPLVSLCNGIAWLLVAAAACAPVYALWTIVEYRQITRRMLPLATRE